MADYDKQIQDNLEAGPPEDLAEIEAKLEQKQLELDIDQSRLEKEKETLETAMQEKEAGSMPSWRILARHMYST